MSPGILHPPKSNTELDGGCKLARLGTPKHPSHALTRKGFGLISSLSHCPTFLLPLKSLQELFQLLYLLSTCLKPIATVKPNVHVLF